MTALRTAKAITEISRLPTTSPKLGNTALRPHLKGSYLRIRSLLDLICLVSHATEGLAWGRCRSKGILNGLAQGHPGLSKLPSR